MSVDIHVIYSMMLKIFCSVVFSSRIFSKKYITSA